MLERFLVGELFEFLIVFCRIGSGMMIMPGFGELYVPTRIRLLIALSTSLALTGVLHGQLPALPATTLDLGMLIGTETLIGLFIGVICRMMIASVHIASQIISYQSSLSTAMMLDFTQGGQSTPIGNFLSMIAIVLIFVLDLHHLMLRGLAESYLLFQPGIIPPVEDFSSMVLATVSGAFVMAIKIAAPLIVVGLLLYVTAGVLGRLMPNIQIFFIIMAPQIMLSLFVLMVTLSAMMMWYSDYVQNSLTDFLIR